MTIAEGNAPVPENIKRMIQRKGLIQKAVAERAGFTEQQFSDMLNDRRIIRACDLFRISMALGIEIADLLEECKPSA